MFLSRLSARLSFIALSLAGLLSVQAHADRQLGDFEGIAVAVGDSFKCGERVQVRLSASNASAFAESGRMEKLAGTVRALLGFECEFVKDIMLEGYVEGEAVYRAVTSEKSQWAILTMSAPQAAPAPTPPVPLEAESTQGDSGQSSFLPQLPQVPKPHARMRPAQKNAAPSPDVAAGDPERAAPGKKWEQLSETTRQGSFPTSGYNLPVLMSRLYFGELPDIPDDEMTRSVVVSVLSAFGRNCGERPMNVGLAALRYGSKVMREMNRDPGTIFEHTVGPLAKMIEGFESGGIFAGFEALTSGAGMIVTQGVEDGDHFLRTHGCGSEQYRQFVRNLDNLILTRASQDPAPDDEIVFSTLMSPALRDRLGYDDPAVALRKRQLAQFATAASKSCIRQYTSNPFCECMIGNFEEMELADEDWTRVGQDFTVLAKLAVSDDRILPSVKACIQ